MWQFFGTAYYIIGAKIFLYFFKLVELKKTNIAFQKSRYRKKFTKHKAVLDW